MFKDFAIIISHHAVKYTHHLNIEVLKTNMETPLNGTLLTKFPISCRTIINVKFTLCPRHSGSRLLASMSSKVQGISFLLTPRGLLILFSSANTH